jgi:hypothetical protein
MGTFISKLQYQVNKGKHYKLRLYKGSARNTFIVKLGRIVYTFSIHTYIDDNDTIRIAIQAFCCYNKGPSVDIMLSPPNATWNCTPQSLSQLKKIERILKYDGGFRRISEFVIYYVDSYPVSL